MHSKDGTDGAEACPGGAGAYSVQCLAYRVQRTGFSVQSLELRVRKRNINQ